MKRWVILRWTCTAGLALCLSLLIASIWYGAGIEGRDSFALAVEAGGITVGFSIAQWEPPHTYSCSILPNDDWPFMWWFRYKESAPPHRYLWLQIPLWIPSLLLSLPTWMLWRSHLRARRAVSANLCPKCNYSLTGLPAGSACPECGGGKAAAG